MTVTDELARGPSVLFGLDCSGSQSQLSCICHPENPRWWTPGLCSPLKCSLHATTCCPNSRPGPGPGCAAAGKAEPITPNDATSRPAASFRAGFFMEAPSISLTMALPLAGRAGTTAIGGALSEFHLETTRGARGFVPSSCFPGAGGPCSPPRSLGRRSGVRSPAAVGEPVCKDATRPIEDCQDALGLVGTPGGTYRTRPCRH